MAKKIKISMLQMSSIVGDVEQNIKKISEETINKININGNNISNLNDKNDKNFKASENPSDDESPNEPLKYKISSLQKDIRSFYKFKGFLG